MKLKVSKLMSLPLVVTMIVSLLVTACSPQSSPPAAGTGSSASESQSNAASTEAMLPVRYYMPGSDSVLDSDVVNAVNEKLAADGLNLDFQPLYIPWDAWVDKINIMISSNEEFELFQIMADFIPYSTYYSRGAILALDDTIDQYAPELRGIFNEDAWKCVIIEDEVYAIPAEWRDNSGDIYGVVHVRQDKLDAAGITIPENFDIPTLIDKLEELQASWGEGATPYVWDHSPTRPPIALQRTYDTWPFYTSLDGIFQVTQEGVAKAYFETDEFAKDCATYAEMYRRGLLHPDILSVPQDTINNAKTDGNVLAGFDTFGEEGEPQLKEKDPNIDIAMYRTAPEKPAVMATPIMNMNAVPSSAPHPEAGVRFLNWVYGDRENHDLLIYGVEGTHYTKVSDDLIKTTYNADTNLPLHRFDVWMIANLKFLKFEDTTPQSIIDDWKGLIHPVQKLPSTGFTFDAEPVNSEYAQVRAEYDAVILPIKLGVVDYAANIDAAIATMKNAGIDAVIAEYQRQLDAYVAASN